MAVQHHQTIQDDGKFKKQHTIHIQTRLLEQPASCMQAYVHDWPMYMIGVCTLLMLHSMTYPSSQLVNAKFTHAGGW